jgi:sugar phosphate permease
MTAEFGWSRTAISGAVSLGGLLAAIASPLLGPVLDRRGARAVLGLAILSTAAAAMGLSLVGSLASFYVLFCIGRMNFAGPFDLGIYGALASWFVARRSQAISIATLAQMSGLVTLPLVAQLAMLRGGWRAGWLVVGAAVAAVGFLPVWLLLVRRPEDIGLAPDLMATPAGGPGPAAREPIFSRAQALRTPAFWLLSLYGLLIWPVQAGVSLHQGPNLVELGLDPTVAATVVSAFSATSALAGFGAGFVGRRRPVGLRLALAAALMGASALVLSEINGAFLAYLSAAMFGPGIGTVFTLPVAWADFRPAQPAPSVASRFHPGPGPGSGATRLGFLRDRSGNSRPLAVVLATVAALAMLAALPARPPAPPPDAPGRALGSPRMGRPVRVIPLPRERG